MIEDNSKLSATTIVIPLALVSTSRIVATKALCSDCRNGRCDPGALAILLTFTGPLNHKAELHNLMLATNLHHNKTISSHTRVLLRVDDRTGRRRVHARHRLIVFSSLPRTAYHSIGDQTTMEIKDESGLLALPLELLTRITDNISHESLPTVRLTCKTLEGVTFNRFEKSLSMTTCCIYYESRWLSLQRFLHGSERLVQALRGIYFTSDPLETRSPFEVQLAPGKDFPNICAAQKQFDIREANEDLPYEPAHVDSVPSQALIHSVLIDLRERAPYAWISFDFTHTRFFRDDDERGLLNESIFFALLSTSMFVHELKLDRYCFGDDLDMMAHLGSRLLKSTSRIQSFAFHSTDRFNEDYGYPLDENDTEILTNMLQKAADLRRLHLEMSERKYKGDQWALTQRLLFANSLATVEHLALYATDIPENQLCKAIASCNPTLKHLWLGSIRLIDLVDGWSAIFRLLATLPKLEYLVLSCLVTSETECAYRGPRLDFRNIKHGFTLSSIHVEHNLRLETDLYLEGKEVVSAGLQQLLSGPLLFTGVIPP